MGVKAKVHLKIDTGMERIGVHYYSAHTLQEATLKCCRNVEVEGIYSHFASADSADLTYARLQLERFNEVLRFYEKHSLPAPMGHMANSGAVLQLPEASFDMVRPGILMYGVYPSPEVPHTVQVRPALAWKSRVVYFKVVRPGHPVSYGSTWQSDHLVRVVTVPVGYGDGYFRSMSNKAQVIIRGQKYPQVGRVCMDHGQSRMGHGLQRRRSDVDRRIGRRTRHGRRSGWVGWDDPLRNLDQHQHARAACVCKISQTPGVLSPPCLFRASGALR